MQPLQDDLLEKTDMAGKKRGRRRPHRRRGGASARGKVLPALQASRPQQAQPNADRDTSSTRILAATGSQRANRASAPAGAERKLTTAPAIPGFGHQDSLARQNTGPVRLATALLPGRSFFSPWAAQFQDGSATPCK